ncbi:hypothetical protein [Liquorilactobacillus hordei]|uniref:hypothetical protein n=1 Tax=Liquorilactobacillus hordei TaxID=468911 RepID=UPI001CBADF04|nr:hypothetical protein [Liquorilactobacillus hordei]MBZ2406462.1 hypothetical protein [Liquorilactobacillus hordei]
MVSIRQVQKIGIVTYKITKETLKAIIKFMDFMENNKEELEKVSRVTVTMYKWVARKIINNKRI